MAFAQNDGHAAKSGPIVVMITVDGFPARALKDPRLPMPALRMLASQGAQATAMLPINPTVTWPNHTALITGVNSSVHHVIANVLMTFPEDGSAPQVKPWVPEADLGQAETLYEAAAQKGMTTGQVDWVAIFGAKGVRWSFGEKPSLDEAIAQDLVSEKLLTSDEVTTFGDSSPAWRDEVWTDAAIDILTKHTPNLLLLHLLETDSLQHQYAPLTPAAYAAYAFADRCIARVVDAAKAAGVLDRTTFVIASDHGFATYTHTISLNAALVQQGLLHVTDGHATGSVWFKAEGGAAFLFVKAPSQKSALATKMKNYLAMLPGVASVYTNQEAQALGLPASGSTDQAPDLFVAAKDGYAFVDSAEAPIVKDVHAAGAHGYLNSVSDMQALFVASGAGIRHGVQLGTISNLSVAPTVAQILGVKLPEAKQAPLEEVLETSGKER